MKIKMRFILRSTEESNRRTWLYRSGPSVVHQPFQPIDSGLIRGAPFDDQPVSPNQLRWNAPPMPEAPTDFVDGLITMMGGGETRTFFEDSDEVSMLAWCEKPGAARIGFGEVRSIILPASE